VVFNRVAGPTHVRWLTEAVRSATAVDVLGGIPNDPEGSFPERHLGLVMPDDRGTASWIERMAALVEEHVDLDRLLELADIPPRPAQATTAPPHPPRRTRIGVARDEAFCFYYQDNLDLLRLHGAELVEFSPLRDELPPELDGLYIGGGYPELLAAELSTNRSLTEDVRRLAASGRPIYAECGGLMYLSRGIEDGAGERHPFCGVFPFWTRLTERPTLSYVEVGTVSDSIFPPGQTARGHVFHYSEIAGEVPSSCSYRVSPTHGEAFEEGLRIQKVLASYVHLHFLSNPAFAESFVAACAASR
jgi:cobyrinic acid a,c-diamide synthase